MTTPTEAAVPSGPASPAGVLAARRAAEVRVSRPVATQEMFGRVLVDLARDPDVGPYFGQSGTVPDLYRLPDLYPGAIVNAALAALSLAGTRA